MIKIVVKRKISLEDIFVFLAIVYLFLDILSNGTGFSENFLLKIYGVNQIWWNVLRGFVIFKIIVQLQKSDYKVIILLLLAYFSSAYTSSHWMSEIIWILAGTKCVNLKKTVRLFFIIELCALLLVVTLSMLGVVDNVIMTEQNGIVRQSMGFNHPNALAARVFQLEAMYVYLHDRRIKKINVFLLMIISIFTYFLTRAKTVAILSVFMAIFVFLLSSVYKAERDDFRGLFVRIYEKVFRRMKYIPVVIPIVATVFILYLSQLNGSGSLFSRASQAFNYLQYYGLSFWGQPLQINNGADNFYLQNSQLYTLDNSYLYLLIGFGIIFFILFIVAQGILIYRMIKQKEYTVVTILILYMIYGVVETMMIRFTYNFSILFMAGLLWKNPNMKGNKIHENIIYSSRKSIERG